MRRIAFAALVVFSVVIRLRAGSFEERWLRQPVGQGHAGRQGADRGKPGPNMMKHADKACCLRSEGQGHRKD